MPNTFLESDRRRKRQQNRTVPSPALSGPAPTTAMRTLTPQMLQRTLENPEAATPEAVRSLQSSHGNRFVQCWLNSDTNTAPTVQTSGTPPAQGIIQRTPATEGVIQREEYGPLPTNPKARQKEIRRRIRLRQQREHNEKHGWFGSKTYLGKAMSWFSYGNHEAEDSQEYFDSGSGLEEVEDDFEEEEEAEGILSLNKIEINLREGEFESGALSGKGELKGGMEGLKAEGELAYDKTTSTTSEGAREYNLGGRKINAKGTRQKTRGGKAKASGEMTANSEKVEGKGEVNFVYGTSDRVAGTLGWDMMGSQLEGVGSVSHFSGGKLGAKVRGGYDRTTGGLSAKGKASAFLGESVDVKVKVGSQDLGTFRGNLGVSYGVGGELSGSISWEGGVLTLAGKGKAAMGMGVAMGYKLELNTVNLGRGFWSWLSGWGSWAWDVLDSVEEPLLL